MFLPEDVDRGQTRCPIIEEIYCESTFVVMYNILAHACVAVVNYGVRVDMLGGDLIDAATM